MAVCHVLPSLVLSIQFVFVHPNIATEMNLQRILWIWLLWAAFCASAAGQVVTTNPPFPVHNQEVTIIFDASLGNKALQNCQCTVYAHAGVVTDRSATPTSWRYVIGNWGTDDSRVRMTSLGNNRYSLTYIIRTFHNVPANEVIKKMAFVFRNASGSLVGRNADGSDIFVDVYESGSVLSIAQQAPAQSNVMTRVSETVPIRLLFSKTADVHVDLNGNTWFEADAVSQLDTFFEPNQPGDYDFRITVTEGGDTASVSFRIIAVASDAVASLPAEARLGAVQTQRGSLLFTLQAPGKDNVLIQGSFNDWKPSFAQQFYRTPDNQYFWYELEDFDPDSPLLYQYIVDGNTIVADPFSVLVLDPAHDAFIPSSVYPNLPAYPSGKTQGIVSLYPLNETPYEWTQHTFIRPDEQDLVIYELLVRDFVHDHSYFTLIDTLDYLKRMGVNVIQLMPVQEFEGNISWGYNPSFHMALDKYYGTRNALKAFIDQAHSKGMAVIVDVVYNHAFSQSPLCQLYWDAQNSRPTANNPWLNTTDRHPFGVGYDFNHESQATKDWMDRVMRYWIEEFRIDGFRFDLSKGFTQRQTSDVGAWSAYDASRIALLKRMSNVIRAIDPNFYIILEHFADNREEQELTAEGMMVWGNMTHEYNEATMGYSSDFRWADYKRRNFVRPRVITYMESHDEERLMYKNQQFGNSAGGHNTRELPIALKRKEAASVFHYTIPGPKMLWQFGELGYDFSINYCPDGRIDESCRTAPKPIRWDYFTDDNRRQSLYHVTSDLIHLKTVERAFDTDVYDYNLSSKIKRIRLDAPTVRTVAVANFDVVSGVIQMNFHEEGWWYEYFTGDSLWVTNRLMTQTLQPGEYRLYLSRKIDKPSKDINTSVFTQQEKPGMFVFPNPASGESGLQLFTAGVSVTAIHVFSMQGQRVHAFEPGNSGPWISIPLPGALTSGNYLIMVETGNAWYPLKWVRL